MVQTLMDLLDVLYCASNCLCLQSRSCKSLLLKRICNGLIKRYPTFLEVFKVARIGLVHLVKQVLHVVSRKIKLYLRCSCLLVSFISCYQLALDSRMLNLKTKTL